MPVQYHQSGHTHVDLLLLLILLLLLLLLLILLLLLLLPLLLLILLLLLLLLLILLLLILLLPLFLILLLMLLLLLVLLLILLLLLLLLRRYYSTMRTFAPFGFPNFFLTRQVVGLSPNPQPGRPVHRIYNPGTGWPSSTLTHPLPILVALFDSTGCSGTALLPRHHKRHMTFNFVATRRRPSVPSHTPPATPPSNLGTS